MALYVDTGTLTDARWAVTLPPVVGLTCNPRLLAEGLGNHEVTRDAYDDHLLNLASLLPQHGRIFVQVPNVSADQMQQEGSRLVALLTESSRRLSLTLKIPFTEAGLDAVHTLATARRSVAVTGVFTPEQAYMAAASGADFVIPYLSRLAPDPLEPFDVLDAMLEMLRAQAIQCRLLVASVKTLAQFSRLLRTPGCDVTAPPALLREMFTHAGVQESLDRFEQALLVR
ncbi:MAG: transaldolase family protein [Candidatus Xenobia bacterium]